jgi:formylglycine-generating enzyme required for sulfatase activity
MPVSDTDQLTLTGYQVEEIQAEAVEVVQESEEDVNPPIKFESDSATTPEEESEPPTPKDMTPKIPEPATSQPKPRKKSSHKRKPVVQPRFLWLAVSLVVLAGLTWGGITLLLKSDFLNNTNAQSESANPDVTSTVTPEIPATEAVSATPTYTATATATVTPKPTYTIITRTRELDGMVQVYIPAGEVQLGLSEEQTTQFEEMCQAYEASLNEDDKLYCSFIQNSAQNTVAAVEGFWIDQTEVTNSMYEICRLSGACPPVIKFSFTRQVYYRDSQYANYPMMFTYWDEANAYCQWVGGRLPTHAEWRMAAVGTDGRIFPWGDSPPSSSLLNFYGNEIGDTITVGSYPEGVSPYGVYDLLGNVSEWLDDCFISEGGPQGTNGEYCGYAGGSAIERMFIYLVYPGFDNPGGSIGQGFRCVMDDDLEN